VSSGRYKPYSEYHDSGAKWLGDIPFHWTAKRLGQFFDERRDKVSDKNFAALSVTMQGIVPQLETAAKTDDGDNRKLVRANDFVINSRSDRKGSAGVSPLDGSVSLISTVLTPRNIEPRYVHHLLRSYPFQEEFYRFGKGIVADLWSTNYSEMKNILIPELPRHEQTQIAAFLDHETAKIDRLIEKQRALISLLKEKRQAVISHAVTKGLNPHAPLKDSGIEGLGQVPAHWVVTTIRNLVRAGDLKIQDGNHGELHPIAAEYVDKGIPFLMANNVRGGKVDLTGCNFITIQRAERLRIGFATPKDILLTHKGTVGEVAIVPDEIEEPFWMLTPQVTYYRWTAVKYHNTYYYLLFQSGFFQEQLALIGGKQSTRAYVGLIAQGDLLVTIPPHSEQVEIALSLAPILLRLETMLSRASEMITLLQERRTTLVSAAVTGKIDVRHWQLPATEAA
jgi:type I restriction enzyme, S subunit